MEAKKTPQADMERQRSTGFLLGLVLVLAVFYVCLEWNSTPADDNLSALPIDELIHESELVPMSNEEVVEQLAEKPKSEAAEELNIVDDEVELTEPIEEPATESDGDDDELLEEQEEQQDDKSLAAMGVDPANPLNFHIAEDLPQFPGGAVAFMKWLTEHLQYPAKAQQKKIQGQVLAVFYVEKDGSVSGIKVVSSLTPECDREALRVLKLMPAWKPGIQHDKPCRTKVQIPIVFKL